MAKKFHIKTKPVIAKNALDVSFLAPRAPMQVGETLQNKSNLGSTFPLLACQFFASIKILHQT